MYTKRGRFGIQQRHRRVHTHSGKLYSNHGTHIKEASWYKNTRLKAGWYHITDVIAQA